ncbi:uncharacterized protein [Nicotiana sylvestris]|uniref:uncharacterized protein n=1 Tax=Nicotiana sylvestris TaxID=4096 RepID=UPI00388CC809
MKAWSEDFNVQDEVLKTIPLWVRFPNLPINCWSMKALSKIGNILGNPVYADECITSSIRISYARMLIEMDITKPLPRSVKLQDPKERLIQQEVTYDWEPKYYTKCLKIRTDRDGGNDKKVNEQQKITETTQQLEPESKDKDAQEKDEGWITVLGKSAAREAKAKQLEEQELSGRNGFQSLAKDQTYDEPAKRDKGVYKRNNKAIIALVEHRVKEHKTNEVIKKIAPGWKWISNASASHKIRIWVIWDPRIYTFEPMEVDEQLIHGQIRIISKAVMFGFSAIYGLHTIKDRLKLWSKMRQIHSIQQGPWLAMGDYNVVLHTQDRQYGSEVQEMETKHFKEYMKDTRMNELQYVGRSYTWTNNHTYSRIDRGLVNVNWMMTMPNVKVQVLEPLVSDHSPLKLVITHVQGKKNRPFRFFNCIADNPQFMQQIEIAWKERSTKRIIQAVWNNLKSVK